MNYKNTQMTKQNHGISEQNEFNRSRNNKNKIGNLEMNTMIELKISKSASVETQPCRRQNQWSRGHGI